MGMLVKGTMATEAVRRRAAMVSVGVLIGVAGCGDDGSDTDAVADDEATTTTTAPPSPTDEDQPADAPGTWVQVTVDGPVPPPTNQAVLVAPPDGSLWLHGGRVGGEVVDDLWHFDGDVWEHVEITGAAPAARDEHVGVWDEDRDRLIVATGQTTAQEQVFDDVWAFDPATREWELLAEGGPSARYGACAVLDDEGRMLVSHGFSTQERFDDTWAFDLAEDSWTEITPADAPRPAARCLHACGWDPDAGELVLFGGRTNEARYVGDTWRLGSEGWSEIVGDGPEPRVHAGGASTDEGFQILGGEGPDGTTADAWLLADDAWAPAPDEPPSARHSHAVAEGEAAVWVFGGIDDTGDLGDLWRFG
jgi:hypothetical protein